MKSMILIAVFACVAINMMQTDVRVVEIAHTATKPGTMIAAAR